MIKLRKNCFNPNFGHFWPVSISFSMSRWRIPSSLRRTHRQLFLGRCRYIFSQCSSILSRVVLTERWCRWCWVSVTIDNYYPHYKLLVWPSPVFVQGWRTSNASVGCDSGTVKVAINYASTPLLHYHAVLAVGEFGSWGCRYQYASIILPSSSRLWVT